MTRSLRSTKVRKSNPNKIEIGHEIPNNDDDCNRIDSNEDDEDDEDDEFNEDWRNGTTKELQNILEHKFGDFHPKY